MVLKQKASTDVAAFVKCVFLSTRARVCVCARACAHGDVSLSFLYFFNIKNLNDNVWLVWLSIQLLKFSLV